MYLALIRHVQTIGFFQRPLKIIEVILLPTLCVSREVRIEILLEYLSFFLAHKNISPSFDIIYVINIISVVSYNNILISLILLIHSVRS